MIQLKYFFFVLCLLPGLSVFAGNPVEKDTIRFKIKRWPYDAVFSVKGQNIQVDAGDGKFNEPEHQISDSTHEVTFSFRSSGLLTIVGELITDFSYMYDHVIDLDLRRCQSLKNLTLGCIIDSMDLSGNPNLERYVCNGCRFNKSQLLDLSHNPELLKLRLFQTSLTALDLSRNTKLDSLYCDFTRIDKLDLSNNTKLSYIDLGHTPLWPQAFKDFLYSLHDNEIPGKKKELKLIYFYSFKIDLEKGILWNEKEKVSFDKNILKEKEWEWQ